MEVDSISHHDDDESLSSSSSTTSSRPSSKSHTNIIDKEESKAQKRKNEIQKQTADTIYRYSQAQLSMDVMKNLIACDNDYVDDDNEEQDPTINSCIEIDNIMKQMKNTWSEYYSSIDEINNKTKSEEDIIKEEALFRDAYMEMITEAFADELDDLRHGKVTNYNTKKKKKKKKRKSNNMSNNGDDDDGDCEAILKQDNIVMPNEEDEQLDENVDVEVLASCLESGMDIWTKEEKMLLAFDNNKNIGEMKNRVRPHERRRRELFGS
mmetsp:Transcript_2790/g.3289  ORF Transcript_2790/g.3289 Transcript_2790/m.3289 type:complete len:266 (-) Transcript_2790:328-1125(-)